MKSPMGMMAVMNWLKDTCRPLNDTRSSAILSCHILPYPILSYHTGPYRILPYAILSYLILSHPILSCLYPILCHAHTFCGLATPRSTLQ